MKQYSNRIVKLTWGLFLYALGIALTIQAHIGYAPWDVMHVSLAEIFNVNIGSASIAIGIIIVAFSMLFGEKVGLGTLANMIVIGLFLNLLLDLNIIPQSSHMILGVLMLILGLLTIALGSYFYISSGFGAGPRDNLMVVLSRKTKFSSGACRGVIEILVVLVGWKLGGMVGIGTVLSATLIGFCVQLVFNLLKFDPTTIEHETLGMTFKNIFSKNDLNIEEENVQ